MRFPQGNEWLVIGLMVVALILFEAGCCAGKLIGTASKEIPAIMVTTGFIMAIFFDEKIMYSNGNTTSVRNVAVINPPITTVARGF